MKLELYLERMSSKVFYGMDINASFNDIITCDYSFLQNEIKNKTYPTFCGMNIMGNKSNNRKAIDIIHGFGCKIAPVFYINKPKKTYEQGVQLANQIILCVQKLDIPFETAIFIHIADSDIISSEYMIGYSEKLISKQKMICVTSVSVTPKSISINKNSWYYGLSATVLPSNATYKTVTWSSSNTNVATVNASNGYVYGNAAGTATIYATATDGILEIYSN